MRFEGRFEAVFLTTDARISAITEMRIQIYPDGAQMGIATRDILKTELDARHSLAGKLRCYYWILVDTT